MRHRWLREHLMVVVTLGVFSFCCADEEPLLDFSDLNLLHIWVLVGCACATYFDLLLRARVGQFVLKDTTSANAAFTFTWGLENYVRLLLVVFCIHSLMPVELDLIEMVELYQAWGAWLTREILPGGITLVALLGLVAMLNLALNAANGVLIVSVLVLLCLGHLLAISLLVWDLLTAGLSSVALWEETEILYLQPKTALTFDRALGVTDQFEWHRERNWPYALRFEDLYFFLFQFLLAWDLLCSLFFWCCACVTGLRLGGREVSYTQVGLGLAWLEHSCVAITLLYAGLVGIGLRVWLHAPGSLGWGWL